MQRHLSKRGTGSWAEEERAGLFNIASEHGQFGEMDMISWSEDDQEEPDGISSIMPGCRVKYFEENRAAKRHIRKNPPSRSLLDLLFHLFRGEGFHLCHTS